MNADHTNYDQKFAESSFTFIFYVMSAIVTTLKYNILYLRSIALDFLQKKIKALIL